MNAGNGQEGVSLCARLTRGDRFELGMFSLNPSGVIAMTRVSERWQAGWAEIAQTARLADEAGLDTLLPLQRWREYGGDTDPREWCMEAMIHTAALSGITKYVALFHDGASLDRAPRLGGAGGSDTAPRVE
jgi:hypothetical protein